MLLHRRPAIDPRARSLHQKILVADLHSHALLGMTYLNKNLAYRHRPPLWWNPLRSHQDLPRAQDGGLNVWIWIVYAPIRPPRRCRRNDVEAFRQIQLFEEFVDRHADLLAHARNTEEIERAVANGKIACLLALEGGHHLEGRLENLERFRQKGVCYMTLTHFVDNGIAQSVSSPFRKHEPLPPFGREVVREMHRLGILVDIAHATDATIDAIFEACPESVICTTHTGVRALKPLERNIGDRQIKRIAERGGLVGIIALRTYIRGLRGSIEDLVDHVDHVVSLVGPDHVAIGTDFDGFIWSVAGLRDQADLPRLTEAFLKRGYTDEDVARIWGGNAMRVLRNGWDR